MRPILVLVLAASALAHAEALQLPHAYALVALFGDRFNFIYETRASPTPRVDKFRREYTDAPAGTFNRIALGELDATFAKKEPESTRLLLSMPGDVPRGLGPSEREDYLLDRVRKQVQAMPERKGWYRIVVAMPAWESLEKSGLPGRLEGFGIFVQPNCQSHPKWCGMSLQGPSGPDAETPEGKAINANFYVAPYSFVTVVVLDPATLAVLDRQAAYNHKKMLDPMGTAVDIGRNIDQRVLAAKAVEQIGTSLREAVNGTELAGKVEVKDVRDVTKDVKR